MTFTTHKSLCGPRGAVAITHHQQLAETLAWLEARAKAKPGMFEVAMAAAQARKDRP